MIIIVFCQLVHEQLAKLFFYLNSSDTDQGVWVFENSKVQTTWKWSASDELGKKSLEAHVLGNRRRVINIYDIDRCTVLEVQVFFVITSRESETISPLFLSFSFMFFRKPFTGLQLSMRDFCLFWHLGLVTRIVIHVTSFFFGTEAQLPLVSPID